MNVDYPLKGPEQFVPKVRETIEVKQKRAAGYVSTTDTVNEQEIVDAVLASDWGGRWTGSIMSANRFATVDRVMVKADGRGPGENTTAYAEVKHRPAYQTHYLTVLLDLGKWQELVRTYEVTHLPTYWFARFPAEADEDHPKGPVVVYDFANWRQTIESKLFCCRYGGRTDRQDPMDIQPLLYIDRLEFISLEELGRSGAQIEFDLITSELNGRGWS